MLTTPKSEASPHGLRRSDRGALPHTPQIPIDPATYFPKLISEVEIEVREPSVSEDREVYNGYAGLGAFLVHRTQHDDRVPRHHGVYVDTATLIDSARFDKSLEKYIGAMQRAPDVVLAPRHFSAARLIDRVVAHLKTKFGREARKLFHPNLYIDATHPQPQDDEVIAAFRDLGEDSELLIVDDAFVTGTRLYQYSQHLRHIHGGYRGRVHFLVAIARPPAIGKWNEAKRLLSYRPRRADGTRLPANTVTAIEVIVLPNWSETDCPWCLETRQLGEHSAIVRPVPELFRDRLRMLSEKKEVGMLDQLFVKAPHHHQIRLTPGSIFTADLGGQAAGFAAVAGGLQRLRTDENDITLGPYRFPLSTVLKSSEYLQLVYNDSLLRASFLRAAHRDELTYDDPKREVERASFARDLINESSGEIHNLVLELCWQVLEGKLPLSLFELVGAARFAELGVDGEYRYLRRVLDEIESRHPGALPPRSDPATRL